jgi:hypothetical protein
LINIPKGLILIKACVIQEKAKEKATLQEVFRAVPQMI